MALEAKQEGSLQISFTKHSHCNSTLVQGVSISVTNTDWSILFMAVMGTGAADFKVNKEKVWTWSCYNSVEGIDEMFCGWK